MTFEEARSLFPVLECVAYLNAGTFGPLARPVAEALEAGVERDLKHGRTGERSFEETLELRQELRSSFARLVGAETESVALTTSTTEGCGIVLRGLGLAPDDEIVTTTDEHFGLLGPLGASPARVVVVPPDPERIAAAVTPRTRLIATSRVLWTTGAVLPLRELREQCGIPVLADGAQSVGAIPEGADGLDFLTISGQKWLCTGDGIGALIVQDPERLRVAEPSYFSQESYESDGSFVAWPDARRFERVWLSRGSLAGALAALDLRPDWAYEYAAAMAEHFREVLAGAGHDVVSPTERATLVSWRTKGDDPAKVVERLALEGVVVRSLPGRDLVRASVGWWTNDEDLERLVAAL